MFPALATVASPPEWAAERTLLVARIAELERQVAWFQRQLFGEKSERRHIDPPPAQMALGEGLGDTAPATLAPQPVAAHQRQRAAKAQDEGTEPALFFDPERVPVETINVPNPTIAGLPAEAYAVIGEKVTHRLAQRPGSPPYLALDAADQRSHGFRVHPAVGGQVHRDAAVVHQNDSYRAVSSSGVVSRIGQGDAEHNDEQPLRAHPPLSRFRWQRPQPL